MNVDWLGKLQVGDDVIVSGSGIGSIRSIEKVTRKTVTQLTVGRTKFRLSTGREIGSGSALRRDWLEEATPERIAEVNARKRRSRLIYKLREIDWRSQPLEVLEAVAAALPSKGEK
jgi:hypothetical protein